MSAKDRDEASKRAVLLYDIERWKTSPSKDECTSGVTRPSYIPFARFDGQEASVRGAAVHPDGARFVSFGADGILRVWDTRTGALLEEIEAHEGRVRYAVFSKDGTSIVSCDERGGVCVTGVAPETREVGSVLKEASRRSSWRVEGCRLVEK